MSETQDLLNKIASNLDISYVSQQIKDEAMIIAYEMTRPAVLYKPNLSLDGDLWCALYGDNIQIGVVGYGSSPAAAMTDFDNNWGKEIKKDES